MMSHIVWEGETLQLMILRALIVSLAISFIIPNVAWTSIINGIRANLAKSGKMSHATNIAIV